MDDATLRDRDVKQMVKDYFAGIRFPLSVVTHTVRERDREHFLQPQSTKKVYAFIDASNIIYGCHASGWKMDFEKLLRYLTGRYHAVKILYYA